jgi:hypothetical protein
MLEKAVIDRFEGDYAVLFVGEENRQVIVPRKEIPEGAAEGEWLKVELDGDHVLHVEVDEAETASAKQRIAEKLDRLRRGKHLKH